MGFYIKNGLGIIFKGILIGATMLVPGVSGGSMAIILGIYNRLIRAVSSFFEEIRTNILFLLLFGIGAITGMVLWAKPILTLLEVQPKAMGFFFVGAVAGGIPSIFKQSKITKFTWKYVFYIIVGIVAVRMLSVFPAGLFYKNGNDAEVSILFLFVAGMIAAVALILPGISVSYMLLLMGLYHKLMQAISEMELSFLLPMGFGLLVGIVWMTGVLERIMTKYPQASYLIILGFVIGSLWDVFPGVLRGKDWLVCMMTGVIGFYFIFMLSKSQKGEQY